MKPVAMAVEESSSAAGQSSSPAVVSKFRKRFESPTNQSTNFPRGREPKSIGGKKVEANEAQLKQRGPGGNQSAAFSTKRCCSISAEQSGPMSGSADILQRAAAGKPKVPPKPPKSVTDASILAAKKPIGQQDCFSSSISASFHQQMASNSAENPIESECSFQPQKEVPTPPHQQPFFRANSVRKPKSQNATSHSQTNPDDNKQLGQQSPAIRKPSVRPPPPPVQRKEANIARPINRPEGPAPPRLPSNPPPPPPPSLPSLDQLPGPCFGGRSPPPAIYEEIEASEKQPPTAVSTAGVYTPKFRKKETSAAMSSGKKEWPGGCGRRQRRRTTQLELLGNGGVGGGQLLQDEQFACSANYSRHCLAAADSPICRSLFLADSDRLPSGGRWNADGSREFGRFGAGLRQNLAKGVGKLRSRVSALASSAQSPAKTFLQQNFRTLTLGRVKSERHSQSAFSSFGANGRVQSTFYLGEEEEEPEMESRMENEGQSAEELFGDDWSSTDEEEQEMAAAAAEEQRGRAEAVTAVTADEGKQPPKQEAATVSFGEASNQSLLAEIESEYQRLQLHRRKMSTDPEAASSSTMQNQGNQHSTSTPEPERSSTDEEEITTATANVPSPTAAADEPSETASASQASSPGPSPCPPPSYNSTLPERQPLYQIYLLQEQQHYTEVLLEPIGETIAVQHSLQQAKERDEGDSACPDADQSEGCGSAGSSGGGTQEHSASAQSTSALLVRRSSSTTTDSGRADSLPTRRPLRRERLLGQSIYASQRSLWCELTEVKESGLLQHMGDEQKKLQEAYFEVITSEASYLRSINFLVSHFMSAPEMLGGKCTRSAISNTDRKQLFSNILAIRDCSERLLCELELRLKQGLVMADICDILCAHFESHFDPYINYCSNQTYQDRILRKLKLENTAFLSCIQRLETGRQCQGLDMRSFLMLPMQRVTRYPLLIDAILLWLHPDQHQHSVATRARTLANQVVSSCNEGARRMERTEQLLDIERRLVYKCADLKRVPLVSNGRYVVKSGQLTQLAEKRAKGPKLGGSRGLKARPLAFFLFSDMLMVAKRRLNGQFVCKDYAFRRFVVFEPMELNSLRVPPGVQSALGTTKQSHLLSCVLLQNARGRQVELLLSAESESDRERWLSAMRPPTCANTDERVYAEWDCPQALALHSYEGQQEDELSLCPGDLVNILRKMSDGWYYGERIRDKRGGWFPSSYIQQVMNDHVRAQNYRQRLRIIQSASAYGTPAAHQLNSTNSQRGKRSSMAAPFTTAGGSACSSSPQHETPILSRFRRFSTPRAYFTT